MIKSFGNWNPVGPSPSIPTLSSGSLSSSACTKPVDGSIPNLAASSLMISAKFVNGACDASLIIKATSKVVVAPGARLGRSLQIVSPVASVTGVTRLSDAATTLVPNGA